VWYRIDVASPAIVIGLTGGIASGKSAVAARLRQRGAAVIDADELARLVVAPGQPALAEIAARFGAEMITAEGQLDRKRLGAAVFADAAARKDLERITHPRIAAAGQAEIARRAAAGARIVFYEAPLIVEKGLHRAMAALVVVAAPPDVQLARLMRRDGSAEAEARARIAAQLPLEQKLEAATWVIDNGGDATALDAEVARVVHAIEGRFGTSIQSAQRDARGDEF
jgi:dephospho-CoA kinase